MAPTLMQPDDFVIQNRSNRSSGDEWVENYVVVGPGVPATGMSHRSRTDAEAKGRELAAAALVSLWYSERPPFDRGELVESFRPAKQ